MKWKSILERWGLTSLKFNAQVFEAEVDFRQSDRDAAWEMYVELVTRITTQRLDEGTGTEEAALTSVHSLFGITREVIKRHGRHSQQFAKLAIVILNQAVRPFTAKWHRLSTEGEFAKPETCMQFRQELIELQKTLRAYANLLAELAEVEDITGFMRD